MCGRRWRERRRGRKWEGERWRKAETEPCSRVGTQRGPPRTELLQETQMSDPRVAQEALALVGS